MRYRQLGKTGIKVSEIGFGAWGIGGSKNGSISYGPMDDLLSMNALNQAFDAGINFYDTADFYGYGHSEELIGKAFKDKRDKVFIASKVGMVSLTEQNFQPLHILKSIDGSLRRLQTDFLDLYQLHSPSMEYLKQNPETMECLINLKKQGKIKHFGISLKSPEDGLLAIKEYGFETVQVNFNMIDQRALELGLWELCKQFEIGIISRTPLNFGFLTGKFNSIDDFHELDHRSKWPKEQLELWMRAPELFEPIYEKYSHLTKTQIALSFCLSFSEVSTVIPGIISETEITENVKASEFGILDHEDINMIVDIYKKNSFFIKKI